MLPVHNFYVFEFHNSRSDSVAHVKGIHVPFMIYYTVLRMCRLNGHAPSVILNFMAGVKLSGKLETNHEK